MLEMCWVRDCVPAQVQGRAGPARGLGLEAPVRSPVTGGFMNQLTDISTIREILDRHGFHFSKSLGQNFLINPSVCPRMAESCGAGKGVGVLEIGPGIGVLTRELARVAEKVAAIELDTRLLPVLEETLADFPNVSVIHGDVMTLDLPPLLEREFPGMDVVVCANLPYYITSPVIMRLLEEDLPISALTVMVQKEAAVRICADPGTRECGAVSVAVRYYSEPEILFTVSRGSFMPAPNVDSAVIRLRMRPDRERDPEKRRDFFRVVRASFGQRRKTILNSLASGLALPKQEVSQLLENAGIPANARAEQLTMEQFSRLAAEIGKNGGTV